MADSGKIIEEKPKSMRVPVYPTLDHFRRASESGWMRPFDLAEYEACRKAEMEWTGRSFAPEEIRHTSQNEAA
jgi:hypothetical protein